MKHISKILQLVSSTLLIANFETISANEINYKEKDSGTFIINTIDLNQDGFFSAIAIYNGTTTLGKISGQGVSEFSPVENTRCPADYSEFELVRGSSNGVRRFPNGDLLYTKQTNASFCINFFTGQFTALSFADYVGGTGKFAHATGNNTLNISGNTLLNQGFSSFTSEITGTLILPDKKSYKRRYKSKRKFRNKRFYSKYYY